MDKSTAKVIKQMADDFSRDKASNLAPGTQIKVIKPESNQPLIFRVVALPVSWTGFNLKMLYCMRNQALLSSLVSSSRAIIGRL